MLHVWVVDHPCGPFAGIDEHVVDCGAHDHWTPGRTDGPRVGRPSWAQGHRLAIRYTPRVEPEIQASIVESLKTEKAAEILDEMAPDEAADLLAELEEETSKEILEEMDVEPVSEVRELLEFAEDSAGGLMNTEYVTLHHRATVADAMEALQGNEELLESLNTVFLVDQEGRLSGTVPLTRLFTADRSTPLAKFAIEKHLSVPVDEKQDRVTELFDKYNLLVLPVLYEDGSMAGVITADDVISVLRQR